MNGGSGRVVCALFIEQGAPSRKATLGFDYVQGKLETALRVIHFGPQTLGTFSGPPVPNQKYEAKTSADLAFTWAFTEKTRLTVGGTNIFDVKPTVQDANETDNGFKYESVQFGLNGAALFARLRDSGTQVWVTGTDGAAMIRYGESLGILRRQKHELGDVVQMPVEKSILTSYFRNNALHLLLMPSLLACAFLSNPTVPRADLRELAAGLSGEPSPRPWPRSPLAQDERAMEAYLVRHNALMASDGLGGFMPYVDVVAHGEPGAGDR